ncbi:MAG TPA: YetF domain-containing protein [Candidatus Limnocylindria bacterium]|nr:YetF domain-containing protein [Candidatus Limnocylindria bacterium]
MATIIGWSFALDWLAYRVPSVGRIVHPEKAQLVQNGRLIRPTLRREMITEEELMSEIRLQGLEKLEDVRAVYLEGNGEISVIPTGK